MITTQQSLANTTAFYLLVSGWVWLYAWLCTFIYAAYKFYNNHKQQPSPPSDNLLKPYPFYLIRPCTGNDLQLYDNLLSAVNLKDIGLEAIFLACPKEDSCLKTLQKVATFLESQHIAVHIVETQAMGYNQKVAQCHQALLFLQKQRTQTKAKEQTPFNQCLLLFADSDIRLEKKCVAELLSLCQQPQTLLSFAPFVENCYPQQATWGNLAFQGLLSKSLHAFSWLEQLDPHNIVGKLCCMQPSLVKESHDLWDFQQYLGEDVAIAQWIQNHQGKYRISRQQAEAFVGSRTWHQALQRMHRWLMVTKQQRHLLFYSYPLLFCPWLMLLPQGTLILFLSRSTNRCSNAFYFLQQCLCWLLLRLLVACWSHFNKKITFIDIRTSLKEIVACDLLLVAAFLKACFVSTVLWRKQSYPQKKEFSK